MNLNEYNPDFDCTPAQYDARITMLWKALGLEGPQQDDCFTMAAREIVRLRERLAKQGGEHALEDALEVKFCDLYEGQKFATVANNRVVVWTKIYEGDPVFKAGDTDDGYTCPMATAISDDGFPAVFRGDDAVCPVAADRWQKDYTKEQTRERC